MQTTSTRTTDCHTAFSTLGLCRQVHVQLTVTPPSPHVAVQTTSTRTTVTLPFGCADNKHTYNCHIAIWLCRQQAHVQLSHCHLAVQTTSTRTTVTPPSPHVAVQTTNTCIAHCHTARSHTVAVWATSKHTIDCHTTMWLCRQAHVQLTVTAMWLCRQAHVQLTATPSSPHCGCVGNKHTYS